MIHIVPVANVGGVVDGFHCLAHGHIGNNPGQGLGPIRVAHNAVRFPQSAACNGALGAAVDRGLGIRPAEVGGTSAVGQVLGQGIHNGNGGGQGMIATTLIVFGIGLELEIHYSLLRVQIIDVFLHIVALLRQILSNLGLVADD